MMDMTNTLDTTPLAPDDRTWDVDIRPSGRFRKMLSVMRHLQGMGCARYDADQQVWHVRTRDGVTGVTSNIQYLAAQGATVVETTAQVA